MHLSSYKRMEYLLAFYKKYFPKHTEEIKVLDVGSCDRGGGRTYREIFVGKEYCYTGLDIEKGANVDFVPKNIYSWSEFEDGAFDIVISGQTFEYIKYPWLTIKEIGRVLKPSGFCFIIVPSAIHYGVKNDGCRYFASGMAALADWAGMKVHHASTGGVPKTDEIVDWLSEWNDTCLVAQKSPYQNIETVPFEREVWVPMNSAEAYRAIKHRVEYVIQKFKKDKPFVLFGAGWIGDMVMEILGSERVSFYIDNSSIKIGKERKGKKVVAFQDYIKDSQYYNCLITAGSEASRHIMAMLQNEGVEGYSLYEV